MKLNPCVRLKALRSVNKKATKTRWTLRNLIRDENPVNFEDLQYCIDSDELNVLPVSEFLPVEQLSGQIVENVLLQAVHKTNTHLLHSCPCLPDTEKDFTQLYRFPSKRETPKTHYQWPTIANFEPTQLENYTRNYIKLWKLNIVFKYHIQMLGTDEKNYSKYYFVEVIFSTPTPKCPNPLATASVFFTYELSLVVPCHSMLNVTYKFEGYKSIELADNRLHFQQNLLRTILQSKLNVYCMLKF